MVKVYIPKIGERVEMATRHVPKCQKLLDVGCGDGIIAPFLKEKVSEVYGVDKSKKALKDARKKGLIVHQIDLDKEKIPYEDSYFDIVTCLDVIEHIRDPINLMEELYRVLKKGGRLIISAPNIRFSDHLIKLIFEGRFPITSEDKNEYDGGHIHYFTFSDLKEICKKVGFKVIQEVGIINKPKRGIKGKIGELILGKKFMREFRSQGILIIAQKPS